MKLHLKLNKKPICGTKAKKHKLRFATGMDEFNDCPEKERCGNCVRAIVR